MKPAVKQMTLGDMQTDTEEQAEIEAGRVWRAQLWSAMRTFAAGYIGADGQRGLAGCAAALDRRWGTDGRGVSESTLGAALRDSERNYFRLEWADFFAARSPEIADLLARRVKPTKTDKELYEDLMAEVRSELPKRADAVIRNARTR